jgi:hypothetical protein
MRTRQPGIRDSRHPLADQLLTLPAGRPSTAEEARVSDPARVTGGQSETASRSRRSPVPRSALRAALACAVDRPSVRRSMTGQSVGQAAPACVPVPGAAESWAGRPALGPLPSRLARVGQLTNVLRDTHVPPCEREADRRRRPSANPESDEVAARWTAATGGASCRVRRSYGPSYASAPAQGAGVWLLPERGRAGSSQSCVPGPTAILMAADRGLPRASGGLSCLCYGAAVAMTADSWSGRYTLSVCSSELRWSRGHGDRGQAHRGSGR